MQPRLAGPLRHAGAPILRLQSDERLVGLARVGHDAAFTTLVERHRPALVRHASRLVGAGRAEDVVQTALMRAHPALQHDDRELQVASWLHTIVHRTALNVLRGADPEAAVLVESASREGPAEVVERREHLRETLAAVAGLPERQRDALLLRELEGRSHEEIAAALGVSPGAARQQLARARTTVRASFTAVTPFGLVARLAELIGPAGHGATEAAVGAGVAAGLVKVGAGVLAASAVAGTVAGIPTVRETGPTTRTAPALRAAAGESSPSAPVRAVPRAPKARPTFLAVGDDPPETRGRRRVGTRPTGTETTRKRDEDHEQRPLRPDADRDHAPVADRDRSGDEPDEPQTDGRDDDAPRSGPSVQPVEPDDDPPAPAEETGSADLPDDPPSATFREEDHTGPDPEPDGAVDASDEGSTGDAVVVDPDD